MSATPEPTPENNEPVDAFVGDVDLERRCTAREIVELLRSGLGGADERVEGNRAVFAKGETDLAGISISDDHIDLFIPNAQLAESFAAGSNRVQVREGGVRFEQLTDINRGELRRMIDSLDQGIDPESE